MDIYTDQAEDLKDAFMCPDADSPRQKKRNR